MLKFICNGGHFRSVFWIVCTNLFYGGMIKMKKKSNYRTPKRLLSLVLSVLLLLSSFVFAAPTVSKAATSITHKPNQSSITVYLEGNRWGALHNVDYPYGGMSVKYSDGANGKDVIGTWASVYDYNPNATNYLTYYEHLSQYGGGKYQFDPSKLSCSATASTSPTYLAQASSTSLGAYTYGSMAVRNKVYAINTTNMIPRLTSVLESKLIAFSSAFCAL